MTVATESAPGSGGQFAPITDPYTTAGGDSLASIAERAGHSGEWRELALANLDQVTEDVSDEAKVAIVAERAQRAGVELSLPSGWATVGGGPAEDGGDPPGWRSAGELVAEAQNATTTEELDAIEALADGRVTVLNAVSAARERLAAGQ